VILLPRTIHWALSISIVNALFSALIFAQDSHYSPRGQQIPPPACLNLRGAWEGGSIPCTPGSHLAWLNDVKHWRMERRIRIGYDPAR
jgi:gamma-glutamyl hercynylcysteine S-oxide synthase